MYEHVRYVERAYKVFNLIRLNGTVSCCRQVTTFCDNDKNNPSTLHNDEAPSIHNHLCCGRSSWQVMREHADFRNGERVHFDPRSFNNNNNVICSVVTFVLFWKDLKQCNFFGSVYA